MIDDDDKPPSDRDNDSELLLYDFFKYLTSLVLLTLGGLLIVMKDFDPKDVKPTMVLIDIVVISAAGIAAFSGASEIMRGRYLGNSRRPSLKFIARAAPALLAMGIGLFLAMFMDSLN